MKFPILARRQRAHRWLPAIAASLLIPLIPLISGCASPGPPRPPTLNLPEITTDLSAQRIGDTVTLHWTTRSDTTDNLDVKGSLTAEICRTTPPSSTCTAVQRLPVRPGPSQATETLPQSLTTDPITLLSYRVQILNNKNRSAGLSPEAFAAAGAAPPPVAQLRATPTRSGATIEWQPPQFGQSISYQVELDRVLISVPTPSKAVAKPADKPAAKEPLLPTSAPPTEVKLQAAKQPSDVGGTFDRTAQKGQTYTYTAQRVRSVTTGGHTLELRSAVSPAITVVMRDIFPPDPPTGLEAVPGGLTSSQSTPNSIDLSWEPNTETDLAGYIVYRRELSDDHSAQQTASRLTPTPVVGPAFSDKTAVPGHHYIYYVTAIDNSGNESLPCTEVKETLREP